MTTFPSIEPVKTTLGYGDYPQNIHEGLSGGDVRFKLANKRIDQTLKIDYEHLTEVQAQSLITHFNTQNGSIVPFSLSSIIWSAWSTPPVNNSNYQWRYANPLNISISAPNRYNISVELTSVPL